MLDFGIARALDEAASGAQLTGAGTETVDERMARRLVDRDGGTVVTSAARWSRRGPATP